MATSAAVPAAMVPRYPGGAQRVGPGVPGWGAREERPAEPNPKSRLPSDTALELLTAGADQVMTNVRFSGIRRPFGDLPGALDALQRHAHLAVTSRFGE